METELTGAGAADIPWFDSSQKLVYRYPGYSAGAVVAKVNGVWTVLNLLAGTHTYTWNTPILGGRFEDNPNAWWMFYKETVNDIVAGTLVIGTDDKDPNSTYGIEVSVRGTATGQRLRFFEHAVVQRTGWRCCWPQPCSLCAHQAGEHHPS